MNFIYGNLLHLILLINLFQIGNFLKSGAPCSAVEKMKPIHSGISESTDTIFDNFRLQYTDENDKEIRQRCYHEGMTIRVRFKSDQENRLEFHGFVMQARQGDNPKRRVGFFKVQESEFARIHCDEPGAVTHKDADVVMSTEEFFVTWKPPDDYRGQVYFNVTIARNKEVWKSIIGQGNTLSYDDNCARTTTSTITSTTTTPRCSNKINEKTYMGPWTCGDLNSTNEYFNVEEGSKVVIDGPHYVCDGCIFEIKNDSIYTSDSTNLRIEREGDTFSIAHQNITVINSKISLEKSSMHANLKELPAKYSPISNISIIDSEVTVYGLIIDMHRLHYVNIESSKISINSRNPEKDIPRIQQFMLGFNSGCIKWTSSTLNLTSFIISKIYAPWIMKPGSSIVSNGPFLLDLERNLKKFDDSCSSTTLGLQLLSKATISIQNPASTSVDGSDIIIGTNAMLLIGDDKVLHVKQHYVLIVLANSQFYMLESMTLIGTSRAFYLSLEIKHNLNCTFDETTEPTGTTKSNGTTHSSRIRDSTDQLFVINQSIVIREPPYSLPTTIGIKNLMCI